MLYISIKPDIISARRGGRASGGEQGQGEGGRRGGGRGEGGGERGVGGAEGREREAGEHEASEDGGGAGVERGGLRGGRGAGDIEQSGTRAINIDDFRIPDNSGNQPKAKPIVEGGPLLTCNAPIRAITDRITQRTSQRHPNRRGFILVQQALLQPSCMRSRRRPECKKPPSCICPMSTIRRWSKYPDVPSPSRESM